MTMQARNAMSLVQGPSVPGAPLEPVLDVHEIQGNSLVGFNKDHQSFLFFQITNVPIAKRWIRVLTPRIAIVSETLMFRRLYRFMRDRRGEEARGLVGTLINIAFTRSGLEKLTSRDEVEKFRSDAFKLGMAARAGFLGDDLDAGTEPVGWVLGSHEKVPDLMLIVASDSRGILAKALNGLKEEIRALQGGACDEPNNRGLFLFYEQEGEALLAPLAGHEHFGFKDGVSQPGIRGRVSADALDFLTPRSIDPRDQLALTHARPGQPLIWPGQFVLGEKYPVQNSNNRLEPQANVPPSPAWAANGSFVVFRRLRQDVSAFWRFMKIQSQVLTQKYPGLQDLTPTRLASIFVGRWPSGAPIMRTPMADNVDLAAHEFGVNDFQFTHASKQVPLLPGASDTPDTFPLAPADDVGLRCPFASHIRKVNPRDDTTDLGGPERSLLKRVLRRGIPFGSPLLDPLNTPVDEQERGLLFVAYQASIDNQFEFLMTDWANSTDNPRSYFGGIGGGHDPIIGQQQPGAEQLFRLPVDGQSLETITLPKGRFVTSTGGDYFFAPSITALQDVLGRT